MKVYDDPVRFSCERRELTRFARRGFRVPAIRFVDEQRLVLVLEKASGCAPRIFNIDQLGGVIHQLARIARRFGLRYNPSMIDGYVGIARENIECDVIRRGWQLRAGRLEALSELVRSIPYVSIFKDAKPEHWLFDGSRLTLIDFDYVKKSFFLADLGQFVGRLALKQRVDEEVLLEQYAAAVRLRSADYPRLKPALKLAQLQSNLAAIRSNPNLTRATREALDEQNKGLIIGLALKR